MLNKILLPSDGSAYSLRAAKLALELAVKNQSQVEILVVTPRLPIMAALDSPTPPISDDDQLFEVNQISQQIIADTAAVFIAQNIPYRSKVLTGNPAEVILQEAADEKSDLIIIGTRGQSGISRFLLGSVSSKVVSHAHCSVLVAR